MNVPKFSLLLGKTDDVQPSAFWSFGKDEREHLLERSINVLTFGNADADIVIDALQHDYQFLDAELKARQFTPDLAIVVSVGYGFLLEGFEQAPFPTALLYLEWFLKAENLNHVSKRVDKIFSVLETSMPPVQRITGKNPLFTSLPLLGDHFPVFHSLENTEKMYDVVYVGNCNPAVHRERTKFLERLALLPEKYKVLIGQTKVHAENVFLFEQTNLINNQSKICINFSQPHMKATGTRVAHTLLSGAFLLTEHMIDETDFLTPKVHCDFYTQDDLEEKIAYYLEHEDERKKIATQGMEHAKQGVFHFSNVLCKMLEKLDFPISRERPFNAYPPFKQLNALGRQALSTKDMTQEKGLLKALRYFEGAYQLNPDDPEIANNLACVYGICYLMAGGLSQEQKLDCDRRTRLLFLKLSKAFPHDALALFNETSYEKYQNLKEPFREKFSKLKELFSRHEGDLSKVFPQWGYLIIHFYDFFTIKHWEEIFYKYLHQGELTAEFYQGAKRFMLWKLHEWMAEFLLIEDDVAGAVAHYKEACEQMPDAEPTWVELGKNWVRLGNYAEARTCFEKALELNALSAFAAVGLCELEATLGNREKAQKLAAKFRLICERITIFKASYDRFKALEDALGAVSV